MLDPSVRQRLNDRLQRLSADGTLLTRSQLERYYTAFRSRFGPDRLAGLDHVALLETMHAHGTRDSLVYWLEFKNDEEFPARFGSIAGGNALKFGIFRRKESGEWETADERRLPKVISTEEAVGIARKHRDQLLRGVEALRQLPPDGSDADYRGLQEQLDRVAPDVSDLAWGHKYFSLLFPDKLDDYHSTEWQQFQLLKLLQLPPEGRGRYLSAGRFVAAARELQVPMNHLTEVLNSLNWRHRYWRVGTSDGTAARNRWALMREGNCVAVGWPGLGDLSHLEATKEARESLQQLLAEKHPSTPSAIGRAARQVVNFVLNISEGDLVLASDGGTVLGIGKVTGPYGYDGSSPFPHRRPVQWLSFDEWKMPEREGLQTTVHEMKKYPENIVEVEKRIQLAPAPLGSVGAKAVGPPSAQSPRLPLVTARVQSVLERKGQCVLYGPPGTGKTFWALSAAVDLAAHHAFGRPFASLNEGEQKAVETGSAADGLVRLCCFHPAYGYEDFIEGYRPEDADGRITFRRRDGVFKRLCTDAERAPDRRFYLVIDEINRGDIPRIFGELLTVLEKDKRGRQIVLPVSGDGFCIPQNVFVIATMNTADRSISLLDAALRRRFGFIELMPDATTLKGQQVDGIPLGTWLESLNRRIRANVGRDARNLQVGHSYLLQDGRPLKDLAALRRVLQDDILPLVEEYCYEDSDALQKVLGPGLVESQGQRIRHELFEEGQEAALLRALMDFCAEAAGASGALTPAASDLPDEGADEDGDEE